MIPYTPEELIAIGDEGVRRGSRISSASSRARWDSATTGRRRSSTPRTWRRRPARSRGSSSTSPGTRRASSKRCSAITLPPLAQEVWRLAMQTPERQLINPFFTGGEVTRVSYPVDTMTHDDKLMSMRGNTPHFNFATVHHELIPGHHLQAFLSDRFNPHRALLQRTPFWREGWALYWELLLWDRKFPAQQSRQDRHALLAAASRRAHRLLAELSPRPVDAAAGGRFPRRSRRPRARQRGRRSAAHDHRRAAVSGGLHDWRPAVARALPRARREQADDARRRSTTPSCSAATCRSSSCGCDCPDSRSRATTRAQWRFYGGAGRKAEPTEWHPRGEAARPEARGAARACYWTAHQPHAQRP